jgi:hypothetical protein
LRSEEISSRHSGTKRQHVPDEDMLRDWGFWKEEVFVVEVVGRRAAVLIDLAGVLA